MKKTEVPQYQASIAIFASQSESEKTKTGLDRTNDHLGDDPRITKLLPTIRVMAGGPAGAVLALAWVPFEVETAAEILPIIQSVTEVTYPGLLAGAPGLTIQITPVPEEGRLPSEATIHLEDLPPWDSWRESNPALTDSPTVSE